MEFEDHYLAKLKPEKRYELVQDLLSGRTSEIQQDMIIQKEGGANLMEIVVFLKDEKLVVFLLKILNKNQQLQCCLQYNLLAFAFQSGCEVLADIIVTLHDHVDFQAMECNDCVRCTKCTTLRSLRSYIKEEVTAAKSTVLHWSSQTIECLKNLTSNRYPIHADSSKKMYAFVCYNSFDDHPLTVDSPLRPRERADEEANYLIERLKKAGFEVLVLKDWSRRQLRRWMRLNIQNIREHCSVFYLFLMSHGDDGVIHDNDGETEPIDSILLDLEVVSPNDPANQYKPLARTPCVVVIQACQGPNQYYRFDRVEERQQQGLMMLGIQPHVRHGRDTHNIAVGGHDALTTPESDAIRPVNEERSIKLQRPHTALIMATRSNYSAQRHYFMRLFADTFLELDGETDLKTFVTEISAKMSCHDSSEHSAQVPFFSHLLRYHLVLPAIPGAPEQKRRDMIGLLTQESEGESKEESMGDMENEEIEIDKAIAQLKHPLKRVGKLVKNRTEEHIEELIEVFDQFPAKEIATGVKEIGIEAKEIAIEGLHVCKDKLEDLVGEGLSKIQDKAEQKVNELFSIFDN